MIVNRRKFMSSAVGVAFTSQWPRSAEALLPDGSENASAGWQTLPVGAGGYVTGIDIGPDGTKVVRCDTYGCYRWNGSQWVQLITLASLGSQAKGAFDKGCCEIRIAPSLTSRFYMIWSQLNQVYGKWNLYRSDNSGQTWTQ